MWTRTYVGPWTDKENHSTMLEKLIDFRNKRIRIALGFWKVQHKPWIAAVFRTQAFRAQLWCECIQWFDFVTGSLWMHIKRWVLGEWVLSSCQGVRLTLLAAKEMRPNWMICSYLALKSDRKPTECEMYGDEQRRLHPEVTSEPRWRRISVSCAGPPDESIEITQQSRLDCVLIVCLFYLTIYKLASCYCLFSMHPCTILVYHVVLLIHTVCILYLFVRSNNVFHPLSCIRARPLRWLRRVFIEMHGYWYSG